MLKKVTVFAVDARPLTAAKVTRKRRAAPSGNGSGPWLGMIQPY